MKLLREGDFPFLGPAGEGAEDPDRRRCPNGIRRDVHAVELCVDGDVLARWITLEQMPKQQGIALLGRGKVCAGDDAPGTRCDGNAETMQGYLRSRNNVDLNRAVS